MEHEVEGGPYVWQTPARPHGWRWDPAALVDGEAEVRRLQERVSALEGRATAKPRAVDSLVPPSVEALQQELEDQQLVISQLQAMPAAEAGLDDPLLQRRRDNLRRREAERVARLAKGAARAGELEQQLLQKATDVAELHRQLDAEFCESAECE